MKSFLIKATIIYTPYMGEDKKIKDIRLVYASDEYEAEKKYQKYWKGKSIDYSANYMVYNTKVYETIE